MKSRKDRVVRARTASDTTMPEQRSRNEFTWHTCDISLFRVSSLYFPIFEKISLFGISEFLYISYTSPYLEYQISLSNSKNSLLCLIILPILKRKSPYLSSQMYHMYVTWVSMSKGNSCTICAVIPP